MVEMVCSLLFSHIRQHQHDNIEKHKCSLFILTIFTIETGNFNLMSFALHYFPILLKSNSFLVHSKFINSRLKPNINIKKSLQHSVKFKNQGNYKVYQSQTCM